MAASLSIPDSDRHAALSAVVRGWNRRLRLRQTTRWLPFSFAPGILAGLVMALVARMRPWLLPREIALLTGTFVAAGGVVMLIAVWVIWQARRTPVQRAQRFDLLFDLDERVSTALELSEGRIHSNDELTRLQMEDAWGHAQVVKAGDHLPLVFNWRNWVGVLLMAVALAVLLLLPNPQAQAASQSAATQGAMKRPPKI